MSHHYSGPNFGFPNGDARLDFTDLYAFPKPGETGKSILMMNVHPSASVVPLGVTTAEPFAPNGLYEIKIDTDGDTVADIAFRMRVSVAANGTQHATLRRAEGAAAAGIGEEGAAILEGAPVSTGRIAQVTEARGYRFFAGWRSDPFFFDTQGALNDLTFTGADFFHDKNVCCIAIELPNATLGPGPVRLWACTLDNSSGAWVQAERGARPQQAVFLPGDARDAYFAASPADDAQFIPAFAHSLEHSGGYTPDDARRVAASLLPDVMVYDPTRPARFPENGRSLTDDAADVFMTILTNGKLSGDGVGPHRDLMAAFPYAGPPHGADT